MNGPARITAFAVTLAGMVLSMSGCDQLQARDQLNKGVEAYKSAHFEEAISHFQRATKLDPNLPMAKTYLATALGAERGPRSRHRGKHEDRARCHRHLSAGSR